MNNAKVISAGHQIAQEFYRDGSVLSDLIDIRFEELLAELRKSRAREAETVLLIKEIADETQVFENGPRTFSGDSYLPEPIKERIRALLAEKCPR